MIELRLLAVSCGRLVDVSRETYSLFRRNGLRENLAGDLPRIKRWNQPVGHREPSVTAPCAIGGDLGH